MTSEDERRASYLRACISAAWEMGRALVLQPAGEFSEAADSASLADQASQLALRLGSARIEVILEDEPSRDVRVDAYPDSVLSEIFESLRTLFHAVSRAQIYLDASAAIRTAELVQGRLDIPGGFSNSADVIMGEAWELVDIAYLRATAFWDRLGQLLDFVFFNVRQYREGFAETMKKLKANFDVGDLPVRRLGDSVDWVFLRQFEAREHTVLTSKRNVLAHRASPGRASGRARAECDDRIRFLPYSDHLRAATEKFSSLEEELQFLRTHLSTGRAGAAAAFGLCLWRLNDSVSDPSVV